MNPEVYDIECMYNLFTYTGYRRTTQEWFQFVIHESNNQYIELMKHLKTGDLVMIGFNNLNYDYPVIHHMINHYDEYKSLSGDELTKRLYSKSQLVIESDFSSISDKKTYIPQIDVYKIHHWDNPAKATSLKHCEMVMRMDNIEEMPLPHWMPVSSQKEIQMILDYNKHDVLATNLVFNNTLGNTDHSCYKGKNLIALRQLLSKNFKINLLNHNDVKIGEDLVFKMYAEKSDIPEHVLKREQTKRPEIKLKDCIPDYISFKTPQFKKLLEKWKKTKIHSTKKAISDRIVFKGMAIDYGTGGIHGSNSGVFVSDEEMVIIDADVASLYPSIIVQNGYYPEHMGPLFLELYSYFLNTRLEEKKKPKKERNAVIMEGYKLMVNGIKYLKF